MAYQNSWRSNPSICNCEVTRAMMLFSDLKSLSASHWRQVTLDSGAYAAHKRTVVPLSLFVTITSDVTGANNVIPLRTPSHSAHPSLSSPSVISSSFSPPFLSSARSRCTRIRAPTRLFLDSYHSRYRTFATLLFFFFAIQAMSTLFSSSISLLNKSITLYSFLQCILF